MYTFKIYNQGKFIKQLTNQKTDVNLYGSMQKIQSSSVSWALFYEGYQLECINEITGQTQVSKSSNNMFWNWIEGKSILCSQVLKLMDLDFGFEEAINKVIIENPEANKELLIKETNFFI
jgi:hypothetical protein